MKALLRFKNTVILFAIIALYACESTPQSYVKNTNSGGALGTSYSLTYLTTQKLDLEVQIDSVFRVMNRSLSTYIPTSDISRINRGETGIVVDHMFQEVFNLSKEIHEQTKGYFDPTVGSLVNAWGFGPGKQIVLDSAKVDSIMSYVGLEKVSLSDDYEIRYQKQGVYLDFNAIAKGYAIDRLAKLMDNYNIDNYLLEVGGELVGKGINKLKDKAWVVGVDDPQMENGRQLKILLELKDKALASSGNYRKFRVDSITGKKYVHTINPKTGFTKNASTLGVTVLANDCATADAYATSFMAMDLNVAQEIVLKQSELEAYFIYLDEENNTKEFMTDGFKNLIIK